MLSVVLFLLFVAIGLLTVRRVIHKGLAPERVVERSDPARVGLNFREVGFPTSGGKQLFGWFIPAALQEKAPAVAVIHGWGGNAEMMLPAARLLHEAGYSVLLFDARCHGRSDEDEFTSLPRFAEDAEHAVNWLAVQPEVDANGICLLGHSVGAGAVLLLASRRRDIRAIISLAAFAHPASTMRRWLAAKHIPYWPVGWLVTRYVEFAIGHRFDAIAPRNTIRRVGCATLLLHGTADETVPVSDAQEIFAARSTDDVELRLIPGSHDDYGDLAAEMPTVRTFLENAKSKGYHGAHLASGASPT